MTKIPREPGMNSVDPYLRKLQQLLCELFPFDRRDSNFGLDRVLDCKRKQANEFIPERLPGIVGQAFAQYSATIRPLLRAAAVMD